jgi:hypothetical protein
MSCERCGGFMVIDRFCDLMEEEFRRGIETVRCLNCGNFEDVIIRTNRASSCLPRHGEPRTQGIRRQDANQLGSLKRAIQTEPVIADSPSRHTSRIPGGTSSLKTQTRGRAYIKHPIPIIQARRK